MRTYSIFFIALLVSANVFGKEAQNRKLSLLHTLQMPESGMVYPKPYPVATSDGKPPIITAAHFSPDGSKIVAVGTSTISHWFGHIAYSWVYVWDVKTGKLIGGPYRDWHPDMFKWWAPTGYNEQGMWTSSDAQISPDNSKVLVTAGNGGGSVLYDLMTSKSLLKYPRQPEDLAPTQSTVMVRVLSGCQNLSESKSVAIFSPDGKTILTNTDGSSHSKYVLRGASNFEIQKYAEKGHKPYLDTGVQLCPNILQEGGFSNDGTKVFTDTEGEVFVYDATTSKLIMKSEVIIGILTKPAFSPDGGKILLGFRDLTAKTRFELLDVIKGTLVQSFNPETISKIGKRIPVFSPDGSKIAIGSGSGEFFVYEVKTGKLLYTLPPDMECGYADSDTSFVQFSTDSQLLLTTFVSDWYGCHTSKLWNAQNGQLFHGDLHKEKGVRVSEISTNGSTILTAGADGIIKLWKLDK